MWQIPVNRWTVGVAVAVIAFFGQNLIDPVLKALAVMTASHLPAI